MHVLGEESKERRQKDLGFQVAILTCWTIDLAVELIIFLYTRALLVLVT